MFSHQQTQTLKRACSHFELESPFPETLKKKKYSPQINSNNMMGSTGRPISPISSIYEENKIYQPKQNSTEQQYPYQDANIINYSGNYNNNNNNNFTENFMTPVSTPLNQKKYISNVYNMYDANSEPYCEVEDYMAKGYENLQYNSGDTKLNDYTNNNNNTSIQYSLYDLTQEELDMMMMDDTTLTNINSVC